MKSWLFFLLLGISIQNKVGSQNSPEYYYKLGDSLYSVEEHKLAIIYLDSARVLYDRNSNWNQSLESLIEIGYAYDDWGKVEDMAGAYQRFLPVYENKPDADRFLIAKVYNALGYAHRKMESYQAALGAYEKAISIYEGVQANHSNVAYAYRGAAQIYQRRLELEKAVAYLEKALTKDSTKTYYSSILMLLAGVYDDLKDYEKVVECYKSGITAATKHRDIAALKSIGAMAYQKKGDWVFAEKLLKESIRIIESNPDIRLEIWKEYMNLADLHFIQGHLNLARELYRKALKEAHLEYPSKNRELAKVHSEAGLFFFNLNMLDSALSHYQQALIQVFPGFHSTDIADNPDIGDIYTESWIMTASARKGEALKYRYDKEGNAADLENASECFDLSIAGIQALKDSYGTDAAKLYLGDYSHTYFEQAIEVNYLLFKKTGQMKYLEKVFALMEKSKATVLAEAVQKNRGLILSGIPDSLLTAEQELRILLADLTKEIKLEELKGEEGDMERIANLKSRLTNMQREYEALLARLKSGFPKFRSYTEAPPLVTISHVRQKLSGEAAALLEYFVGEKAVYLVVVNSGGASVHRMGRNKEWEMQVRHFLDYFRNSSAIASDPDCYLDAAADLCRLVFTFFQEERLPVNLIIVPDGPLNFVPFDALVTEQPEKSNLSNADFLVRRYNIRYAYSAGLLLNPLPAGSRKGRLLRVAPLFAKRERSLPPLQFSSTETGTLRSVRSLEGEAATLIAFRTQAPKSRLIHLATHAGAADNLDPRIEFIDTALLLPELYAFNLTSAELVVLSACQTGMGKFEKGEGVMSLARGFTYAGASNLVASLWNVNEASTASIFAHFYESLVAGKRKSEALRAAKLKYMEEAESDARLSPYYWAGFIFIGNDGAMDFSPGGIPGWMLAAIAGAGLLGLLFWRRKKLSLMG